jgi:hypothetical protein
VLDAETISLLKKDFGLKENHLVILAYLLDHKKSTAEEIYANTKVPKGRTYEFLTDLVESGFVDIQYSRPKMYSIENIAHSFERALAIKESELLELEKKTGTVANRLRRKLGQAEASQFNIDFTSNDDEIYSRLSDMVVASPILRVSSVAPVLFTKEQQQTFSRRKYKKTLLDKVDAGQLHLDYLFAWDLMSAKISANKDREAVALMYDLLNYPNVDMRTIRSSDILGRIFTGALAEKSVLLTFYSIIDPASTRRNAIFVDSAEFAKIFSETYSIVFNSAQKLTDSRLKELEEAMP